MSSCTIYWSENAINHTQSVALWTIAYKVKEKQEVCLQPGGQSMAALAPLWRNKYFKNAQP